jgi:carbamoyltransferase
MSNKLIISAYGSHNAAVSMYYKGVYTVVEVERWLNLKNAGLTFYLPSRNPQLVFDEICQYLLDQTDRSDVDVYISGYMGKVTPKFSYRKHIQCDHHVAHAAGAFYQSPYRRALVFTFDGGGDGGFFNAYVADRTKGIDLVGKFDYDLGFPYMILADYLSDIKKESLSIGNLVYAGKLMGLCSYGKVREEWLPHFDEFYDAFKYSGDSFIGGAEARVVALPKLFKAIGVEDFDINTSSFEGQLAWDIAATTQAAFERQFFKHARPFLEKYDLPVCMSGGCALNVLLNTKLMNERKGGVYVPPNTNDCGISAGALLWHIAPDTQVDLTYSGLPILDDSHFSEYMESGKFEIISGIGSKEIARFIADGNILGVVQGNSEHGSRALGNRSIICNPVEGMKDTLNHKVKNREWYRPFAPIVRIEDTNKYFHFSGEESRHMVYVAEVREEWRAVIPAITHEDGTGRLQTLTRGQNELIYDVITEFEQITGHGVILNTSFNVNGKPILTRLSDALLILETSKLDAVFYKGNLIVRAGELDNYRKYSGEVEPTLADDTTVYLMVFDDVIENRFEHYRSQVAAALANPGTRVVIVANEEALRFVNKLVNDRVAVHPVAKHRHYYAKIIQTQFPVIQTTVDFARLLNPLWLKEAIRENVFKTKYHVMVNATVGDSKLSSFLPNVITMLKDQKPHGSPSIVSAYKSQGGESIVKLYDRLIAGRAEDLDWLLTNYEGIMSWELGVGNSLNAHDILNRSFMGNRERFKPYFLL